MRVFLFLFALSLTTTGVFGQAGVREVYGGGYTFDAEKYKIDVGMAKLKNQPVQPYQPSTPKYSHSEPPKEIKVYPAPKYPKDTLVFELSDFTVQYNQVYGPEFNHSRKEDSRLPVHDTLLLKNTYKPSSSATFGIGNYYVIPGLDKDFNANKGIYCLLKKVNDSDKKFYGIKATIVFPGGQDTYFFWVNNKGEIKIDQYLWNQSIETISRQKSQHYFAGKINEIAMVKNAEKLSFLCNGKEVFSKILEHPRMQFSVENPLIIVETGVQVCLYGYRSVWFPY